MNDARKYNEIQGPDRIKIALDKTLQEAAAKGRKLKVEHITSNYAYSSFVDEPRTNINLDQVLSREKAAAPFKKEPEGAPFWKYNVKDAVINKPVKSYKFSKNPDGHETEVKKEIIKQDFSCGRIHKRLEALKG